MLAASRSLESDSECEGEVRDLGRRRGFKVGVKDFARRFKSKFESKKRVKMFCEPLKPEVEVHSEILVGDGKKKDPRYLHRGKVHSFCTGLKSHL